jgi:hypothetical protein
LQLGIRVGGLSTPRSGRYASEKDLGRIVQEAVWVWGPPWTAQKISSPQGFDPRTSRIGRRNSLKLRHIKFYYKYD